MCDKIFGYLYNIIIINISMSSLSCLPLTWIWNVIPIWRVKFVTPLHYLLEKFCIFFIIKWWISTQTKKAACSYRHLTIANGIILYSTCIANQFIRIHWWLTGYRRWLQWTSNQQPDCMVASLTLQELSKQKLWCNYHTNQIAITITHIH